MTDNEIIKALQRMSEEDPDGFSSDVLDLVNRQKAEIEGLKKQNSISQHLLSEAWHSIEEKDKFCETVKTEAIREFAKVLIDNAENRVIAVSDLPDLVMDFIEKELENDKN